MSAEAPRLISFTPEGFAAFLNVLHSTYGSAGDAMIYDMSVKYGLELIRVNLPNLPEDVGARIASLRILIESFGRRGWGKLTFEEFDLEGGTIRVLLEDRPFECLKGPSEAPACIFIRGTLAGLISAVVGRELRVRALDCTMKDQNVCRYIYDVS